VPPATIARSANERAERDASRRFRSAMARRKGLMCKAEMEDSSGGSGLQAGTEGNRKESLY